MTLFASMEWGSREGFAASTLQANWFSWSIAILSNVFVAPMDDNVVLVH